MTFKLKVLGLALMASLVGSFALSTVAKAIEFHSASHHTFLTAGQTTTHEFTLGEGFGGVSCVSVNTEATSAATTETENVATTTQSGCKDSFNRTVHISNNGCQTRFHATAQVGTEYVGNADLLCPAGKNKVVTITSGGAVVCTITFGPQENMGPAKIRNESSKLRVTLEVNNLKSTTSGGFFNCGISNGEHTAGTYTGVSVLSGTDTAGNPVKIWLE